MSFRTRLTSFFLLIVVVPMLAVGLLVFRLIGDSEQGKADARANGLATAAASIYNAASAAARADAQTIARETALIRGPQLGLRLSALARAAGLARVRLSRGQQTLVDVGDHSAIAPGAATSRAGRGASRTVTVSELSASRYERDLAGPGEGVAVRQAGRTLASSLPTAHARFFQAQATIVLGGRKYRLLTQRFAGFGGSPVEVTVFSDQSATATSVGSSQLVAAAFIAGFLLLAFAFSVLASRALEGQLGRFLHAARRIAGGDFSARIPTEGHDEFAALGDEFNNMSSQLERRIDELGQERARLRESIRRIGQTFASNLDRPALLELALRTAVDSVQADCGRLSVRSSAEEPLAETARVGSLAAIEDQVYDAEREALREGGLGQNAAEDISVASVVLGPVEHGDRALGVITVGRRGGSFTDADRDVLRSFASQATLALENVDLHLQVSRQAVTDELTGLANHGRFQELLASEMQQVRRYHHQVALIMLDIDDFKSINDICGHQQGDVVLKHVAAILRESSRDTDVPARYGGEEMALILPHTDLEGSYAIAERVRTAIEALRIPRVDAQGSLGITASLGVAATTSGDTDALIAEADRALYVAKRQGKNRTARAQARTANVFSAE